MVKVLLDANFLVSCLENRIDFVEEINRISDFQYELVVPLQVLSEIKKISIDKKLNLKKRDLAKLTLDFVNMLINTGKIKETAEKGKTGDEVLINLSKKEQVIAATLDKELKEKMRKVIVIKGGKRLGWA